MEIVGFRKDVNKFLLPETVHNRKCVQVNIHSFGFYFVLMISLVIVVIFSGNTAYGARKIITWQSMFEDVRAYENAMQAEGIYGYDIMRDATYMFYDANAYEQAAHAFIDEYINRGNRNAYEIERDFNEFHERRVRDLQRKWSRSKYLVECATKMAEFVRDSNLGRMKSLLAADSDRARMPANRNDSSVTTFYSAPEERDVLNLVERATVLVVIPKVEEDKEGFVAGTGFFVASGIVLTNRHVVKEKNAKVIIFSKIFGRPVPAQVVALSDGEDRDDRMDRDYALLRLDGVPPGGNPTPLTFSTNVRLNEKVTVWGYPLVAIANDPKFKAMMRGNLRFAPDVVYSDGVIKSIQNQDPPFIRHDAFASSGSSGGPLVNTKGQVLGINTRHAIQRQLMTALSATDIIKFMRENGISPR